MKIPTHWRVALCLIGSVVAPIVTMSSCVVLWHRYGWLWGWGGGWWFVLASVAAGAVCLFALPISRDMRVALILLYAIPATVTVWYWAFCFDGYVYNNWP